MMAVGIVAGLALLIVGSTNGSLARVEASDAYLVVRPRGLNVLWAMRRSVPIARSSILDVAVGVPRRLAPSGFRAPGTALPGLIQAGTYRGRNGKVFWLVGRAKTVTVIETNGPFRAVVLQVSGADAATLRAAAPAASSSGRPPIQRG